MDMLQYYYAQRPTSRCTLTSDLLDKSLAGVKPVKTLVHLSDIHFGRVDENFTEQVIAWVNRTAPDIIVVSGDLTQRARTEQFQQARRFLDRLPQPQIIVPGNHDIPLYNVFARFFTPLDSYRAYITSDLEPWYLDSDVAILGINTARSRAFKNGRINETQMACIQRRFCSLDDRIMKILVTHHPFDLPQQFDVHKLVGRAKMAMQTLARCGADILLAGHFHMSSAGDTTARYSIPGFSALVVQAGTAISTRTRGEANSFNILRIEHPRVVVEPIAWNAASGQFELVRRETFRFGTAGWNRGETK